MKDVNDDAMPGGVHPALAHLNREQLFHIARGGGAHGHVVVLQADVHAAYIKAAPIDAAVRERLLTLQRITAPAPYVGPEQRYIWEALTDELGRSIADDHVYRLTNPHEAALYGYDWEDIDDTWERRNERTPA